MVLSVWHVHCSNPLSNPMMQLLLSPSFYKRGNWGSGVSRSTCCSPVDEAGRVPRLRGPRPPKPRSNSKMPHRQGPSVLWQLRSCARDAGDPRAGHRDHGQGWSAGRPGAATKAMEALARTRSPSPATESRAPSPPRARTCTQPQDPYLDQVLLPDVGSVEGHIVPHH